VLFRQPRPVRGRKGRAGRRTDPSWTGVNQSLFETLRALRLELARARGVPPYVIFHDQTLRELARHRPTTVDALYGISGIGERKAQAFGPALLEAIARHG
jgi:ATP-dependent DNA helicase RecQ